MALAWARFHRQLPAQRRHVERLELGSAIRGLGLEREFESAYLAQLAAVEDSEGAMRAVLDEAKARRVAADRAQASIEIMKAEGHNVLKLRQRALETNVPSVDYVPIDPAVDGMTSAGVVALEHLRSMLDTVVYVAKSAQVNDERLARIRSSTLDPTLAT